MGVNRICVVGMWTLTESHTCLTAWMVCMARSKVECGFYSPLSHVKMRNKSYLVDQMSEAEVQFSFLTVHNLFNSTNNIIRNSSSQSTNTVNLHHMITLKVHKRLQ